LKKTERTPIRARDLVFIPFKDHDEWLDIRKHYVGGSDAGAIVGMNPYNSAFSVWAEKTGAVLPFSGNIATRTGTMLEELVAKLFMEETGKKVQKLNYTLVNPDYPFACANIDREIIGEDAILECKTTNSYVNVTKFKAGEFPDIYYCQCVHYLAVTGAKKAYIAVLSECRDFRIFELNRDEDEIKALMDAERDFWDNHVLTYTPPPVDGHSATTDTITQMFDTAKDGKEEDLSDLLELFELRKTLKGQLDNLKGDIDALDNRVKVRMENAISGTCGRFSVTWKVQNTSGLDRKKIKADYPDFDFSKYTTQSRVFRVNEKKGKTA
jgi:putative phage-type endonuclease